MASTVVTLVVNGEPREFLAAPGDSLLTSLRERLGLTAAKRGCAQGTCGTCAVRVDGRATMSCLVAVETVDGAEVATLEGVAGDDGGLDEVQAAFLEGFATQCGFCTAGMIMTAEALLDRDPEPSREDVVEALSGNVCRCTGYAPIVAAVLDAAARRRAGSGGPAAVPVAEPGEPPAGRDEFDAARQPAGSR
jgi:carbon-monoxide dehydrogenase small subunit